jgi:transposase-like protein
MQCTTEWKRWYRSVGEVAHAVAVLGLVWLTLMGRPVEGIAGWVACPPRMIELDRGDSRKKRQREKWCGGMAWRAGWAWMRQGWQVVAIRSGALLILVCLNDRPKWGWVSLLPWMVWVWRVLGVAWPRLGQQVVYRAVGRVWEEGSRWALIGLGLMWLMKQASAWRHSQSVLPMGVCWGVVREGKPSVEVEGDEEGWYHVQLKGEFELHVDGKVAVYKRVLVIFLGLLEVAGERRGSRRTRDERTPFVRQEQMAEWFEVPQPHISRWNGYWLKRDWRGLLSQRWGEVLTEEVRRRVIESWVQRPWWTAEQVWQHLRAQGGRITLRQVKQIAQESGWSAVRQSLKKVYQISAEAFRPRDEWLVKQLLAQVGGLVEHLEALDGLTTEQRVALADLEAQCGELELRPAEVVRPLPWLFQVERLLFGQWEWVDDGTVRCIYCGTTDVSRKSRKPRVKRYVDEQGNEREVEVYRYYCHNPACKYKTFTNLPPDLVPYSKWTLNHHLAALQHYEWSHSVYRCTSQMLGVGKMTAYRWVSAFGYQLLPVAALFGVVRSSGVIGIDEKYVLVPKNDKPESDMKRWMYVYLAVDSYTYDLLHVEIYPYNTQHSARAFLLALRAKGYYPRVIVTDLRSDYRDVVAQVFPKATHHECIFHALQDVHQHLKDAYGADYAEKLPRVAALKDDINHILDARTKRTAWRRYEIVLAQREAFVSQTPEAAAVFDFLERHWPTLVNTIESRHIPATNNATEQVIRIFNQHYKTFCGFESIETARLYLAVFEKVYRFTPFFEDAQERIRGKCPLELAGYEVRKLPMAHLFRGLALQWPASAFQEVSPT